MAFGTWCLLVGHMLGGWPAARRQVSSRQSLWLPWSGKNDTWLQELAMPGVRQAKMCLPHLMITVRHFGVGEKTARWSVLSVCESGREFKVCEMSARIKIDNGHSCQDPNPAVSLTVSWLCSVRCRARAKCRLVRICEVCVVSPTAQRTV